MRSCGFWMVRNAAVYSFIDQIPEHSKALHVFFPLCSLQELDTQNKNVCVSVDPANEQTSKQMNMIILRTKEIERGRESAEHTYWLLRCA